MGYASKYYDPQKAHEYYEKHKKLKGRRVTLNDQGKAAQSYVKEQMSAEKQAALEQVTNTVKEQVEFLKKQISNMKDSLSSWSERIKNMPSGPAKKAEQAKLKAKRAEIKGKTADIRQTIKNIRATGTAGKKAIRESYKAKQEAEIEKIRNDSSMVKSTGKAGGGKKKKTFADKLATIRENQKKRKS